MARKKIDRGARDVAGVGPDPKNTRHLMPLGELKKFRIASGEPDIRGWNVYTSSGKELGEVEELLVDPTRGEVVMLDVDLVGTNKHTLAPLRAAWVDRDNRRVVLDGVQFNAEEEIPSLTKGNLTDDEARRFTERYDRTYGERGWEGDAPYSVHRANEELRFGRRHPEIQEQPSEERREQIESRPREVAPGVSEVVVERRTISADDPEYARIMREYEESREVRYASAPSRRPEVVEEVVVRRRIEGQPEA
jgi:sporulation protein YlmC with PRC-barrel domain